MLAAKLFPWSLLWLNPAYYLARIASGIRASILGRGETANYPGFRGKLTMMAAFVWGDLEALPLLPRMLRKRRRISAIRKLTPSQVKELILRNRISLRELNQ